MTQNVHDRIAELHNLAGHTHFAAAVAHRKKDYVQAQQLSEKAHDFSVQAHEQSEELAKHDGKPPAANRLPR